MKHELINNVETVVINANSILDDILQETKKRNKKTDKLSEFIATAKPAKALSKAEEKQLAQLNKQIDKGQKLLNELLPCEHLIADKVKTEVDNLIRVKNRLEIRKLFPKLDRSFLKEKDNFGLPTLACFLPEKKFCTMTSWHPKCGRYLGNNSWTNYSATRSAMICHDGIDDQNVMMATTIFELDSIKLEIPYICNFVVKIPKSVKQNIINYNKLFTQLLIINNADWVEIKSLKPTPQPISDIDPILVGFDGENLWLIDIFDGEPIEDVLSFITPEEEE